VRGSRKSFTPRKRPLLPDRQDLALPLFVPRIRADHPDDAFSTDDAAIVTPLGHCCGYLHLVDVLIP
jgi:hypothetical protein